MEAALHKTFDRQLSDLRLQSDQQLNAVQSLYRDFGDYKRSVSFSVTRLRADVETLSGAVGSRSGGQQ